MAGAVIAAAFFILSAVPDYASAAETAYEIKLRESAKVTAEHVYLGDIADIEGSGDEVEMIRGIRLGTAPTPGNYRLLSKKRLKSRLKRGGWHDVVVKGPERIKIWRASRSISKDTLALKIEKSIIEKMPWPKDKVELEVHLPSAKLLLPEGRVAIEVELPRGYSFMGKESVLVKLFVDGREYKRLWVKSVIRLFTEMVLASRPILRNEVIKEEALKVERRLVSSLPRGLFDNVSEVKGMRAKRKIRKGAVIMEADLALPPLFKRGSMVTILAGKGGLVISAKGRAMEKGIKGKVIRVENIGSKKVVLAEVLDSRTVMVGL